MISRGWILCCFCVLLAGCEPEIGRIVWLIGDSIAVSELEALHRAQSIKDNADLTIPLASVGGSALGRDQAYFIGRIQSARQRGLPADAAVVSFGTNDCGTLEAFSYVDAPEKLGATIDAFLGSLPEVPVIWLLPASPASPAECRAYIVAGLEAARERWPKLELLAPDPIWYADGDQVHYSEAGEELAAQAIVARLDALEEEKP